MTVQQSKSGKRVSFAAMVTVTVPLDVHDDVDRHHHRHRRRSTKKTQHMLWYSNQELRALKAEAKELARLCGTSSPLLQQLLLKHNSLRGLEDWESKRATAQKRARKTAHQRAVLSSLSQQQQQQAHDDNDNDEMIRRVSEQHSQGAVRLALHRGCLDRLAVEEEEESNNDNCDSSSTNKDDDQTAATEATEESSAASSTKPQQQEQEEEDSASLSSSSEAVASSSSPVVVMTPGRTGSSTPSSMVVVVAPLCAR